MCMCMQKLKIFESLDITQQIKEKTERKVKLLHLLRTVKKPNYIESCFASCHLLFHSTEFVFYFVSFC